MVEDNYRVPSVHAIRTLIADDNEMVRTQIGEILTTNPALEICGRSKDGSEAVDMVRELRPNFVILDISMPGLNGFEAASQIRQLMPSVKIVILSMHESPQLEAAALRAGADAIVSKRLAAESLISAIDRLFFADSPAQKIVTEEQVRNSG
ncbi:MAG TPA: response regulator transcription factor [Candidatus Acidoferrales bacterium]|jgi:DNA-binding NarL/FixJ family response regulator|nr:response regulator transcription factor [Candidatus Acidoferrales bacterium]